MRIDVRRRPSAALPVTMADLAFLLIMFLTLTLDPSLGGDVELPVFRYAIRTADQYSVSVAIARGGALSVDGRPVTMASLEGAISASPTATVVTVYADGETEFGVVDQVLTMLRQIGRYRVVLAAKGPS